MAENQKCGNDLKKVIFLTGLIYILPYHRVEDKDSFFSDEVMVELQDHNFNTEHKFCKCEKQSDGTGAVTCNYHYDVDNCQVTMHQFIIISLKDKTH